jgi:hypothetical protein
MYFETFNCDKTCALGRSHEVRKRHIFDAPCRLCSDVHMDYAHIYAASRFASASALALQRLCQINWLTRHRNQHQYVYAWDQHMCNASRQLASLVRADL